MKTTVIGSNKGKSNSSTTDSKNEKVNGLPVSTAFDGKAKAEAEPKKEETTVRAEQPKQQEEAPKAETEQPQAEQAQPETPKAEAEQPQAEPTKAEIKAALAEQKPVLNLEQTLKKIKDLSRLSNQRDKLIETTDTLDAFEIAQMDDAEETNLNQYQGCTLIIKDDTGREFKTKNPYIIDRTAKQIKTLCYDKLAEVEGQISLTL